MSCELCGGVCELCGGVGELCGGVCELCGGVCDLCGGVCELCGGVSCVEVRVMFPYLSCPAVSHSCRCTLNDFPVVPLGLFAV